MQVEREDSYMSKSKNKGGKPAQNNKEVSKKTDVKDVKEVKGRWFWAKK